MKCELHEKRVLLLVVAIMAAASQSAISSAFATEGPVKEVLKTHVGAKVDVGTGANICTVPPNANCKSAEPSEQPGGFEFPEAVATYNTNVYVADSLNHRVQEFEANGTFIRMFGHDVNKTAHANHEAASENVCPVKTGDECQSGLAGGAPGQLNALLGIAINRQTGNVYVAETISDNGSAARVQEFTAEGRFVLEIGEDVNAKEVNATSKRNVCTEEEIEVGGICSSPKIRTASEPNGDGEPFIGDQISLTLGGPEELLYIGDEHRIDEFATKGKTDGEPIVGGHIDLTRISSEQGSRVTELTVQESGDILFTYESDGLPDMIYKVRPDGTEATSFPITLAPRVENTGQFVSTNIYISALAVGENGDLAVAEREKLEDFEGGRTVEIFGSLLDAQTGHLITEFTIAGERNALGVAFDTSNELFAVTESDEMLRYEPVPVGEFVAGVPVCAPGNAMESSDTFTCTLDGTVNAEGVADTEVWFEWGATCLFGHESMKQSLGPGETPAAVNTMVISQKPNEALCFRLVGEDLPVKAPEKLTSEAVLSRTPIAPPKIVGEPSVVAEGPFTAAMFSEINPENTATSYHFEYGPCVEREACSGSPYPESTLSHESAQYGAIGTVLEASGLQPDTLYHYRLAAINSAKMAAVNEKDESVVPEGRFMTAPAPKVEADTGGVNGVTATSASIYGSVNPDGQAAAYQFELGVYRGAATEYGVVVSGTAGLGSKPVSEKLTLTGLRPGTSYAYRITAHSGDGSAQGSTAIGAVETFTTSELPVVLNEEVSPELLQVPKVKFPSQRGGTIHLTNTKKLAMALKACRKKVRRLRPACERKARKRYGVRRPKK